MYKVRLLSLLGVFILLFGFTPASDAVVLTFDDIPEVQQNTFGAIGTYGGFEFHGDNSYDRMDWIDTVGSPWDLGAVSGDFTMLNNYGGNATIVSSATSDNFTFNGLWARIWYYTPDRAVTIKGYNNGTEVVSSEYTLTQTWTYLEGWDNISIDSLYLGLGNYFLVDDLEINESAPVPEPVSLLLLGSGLTGLAAFRRKFIR